MKKLLTKLVSLALISVISLLMVVMTTYAWMSMSVAPEVKGLQVTIGGLKTILIAPDIYYTEGDQTLHYPGKFSDTLDFSGVAGYEYLQSVIGLTPYSTADGLHFFEAGYYEQSGAEEGMIGELLPLAALPMDDLLQKANLTEAPENGGGCYVYLDFWVVSPFESCGLHLATGDENGGSFVIDLKEVKAVEDPGEGDRFVLSNTGDAVSASIRIGFLVNPETIADGSMEAYVRSAQYEEKYRSLSGIYQEPGNRYTREADFRIYEPNGNLHSSVSACIYTANGPTTVDCPSGSYRVTYPIGLENGRPALVDVSPILTVQRATEWKLSGQGGDLIDQIFKAYLIGRSQKNESAKELYSGFYRNYLQQQFMPYLNCGSFFNTATLYRAAANDVVDVTNLEKLTTYSGTEGWQIARLEKDVPQRIRMYIWIEGQDVDCVNSAAGSHFAVNLQLSGSTS